MANCDVNDLRQFIANNFLFSDDYSLSDDASFLDAGIIGSIGVLQLILFLEEHYRITVADAEVIPENLDSIECLKSFVERKLNGKCNGEPVMGSEVPGGSCAARVIS